MGKKKSPKKQAESKRKAVARVLLLICAYLNFDVDIHLLSKKYNDIM